MSAWPNQPNFVRIPVDHPPDPVPNQLCRVGTAVGILAYDELYEFLRRNPTVNKPHDPIRMESLYVSGEKPVSFQPATWPAEVHNIGDDTAEPGQIVRYYDCGVGSAGSRSNCAVGETETPYDAVVGILLEPIPAHTTTAVSILMQYARRDWHWLACPTVERDPEICNGAWVFRGTRMPVQDLFLHLSNGDSIEEFLADFPSVSLEQVRQVLQHEASDLGRYTGISDVSINPDASRAPAT